MKKFFKFLENLIYPKNYTCDICGKEITNKNSKYTICNDCYENLPKIEGKTCLRCGYELKSEANYCINCKEQKSDFKQNFSVFSYIPPVTDLIIKFKYNKKKYLGENLSPFLLEKLESLDLNADIIIPVPLHPLREKDRGFNQAEELCKSFVDNGYCVRCDIIKRVKNTDHQTSKTRTERVKNVKDAFDFCDNEKLKEIKDKVVVIIDDVYTTGATLNEIAKTLKKGKPKAIYGLTFAHSVSSDVLDNE